MIQTVEIKAYGFPWKKILPKTLNSTNKRGYA